MTVTSDARALFSGRATSYARFIRAVLYPQGLRAYWLASPLLAPDLRILDAGCGTGALTLAVRGALVRRRLAARALHGFDLTPAMLDELRRTMDARGIRDVALAEADVLHLDALPSDWREYDLVVTASMLEYVPRERFAEALAGLRARLRDRGHFVLFITRRNPLMQLLIGRWWESNLYTAAELAAAFGRAGFTRVEFPAFPVSARYLGLWGHIVQAQR